MIFTINYTTDPAGFWAMSPKDLADFYQWFMGIMPTCLQELNKAVKQTPGYENWQPDASIESLGVLGDWLATQVEIRKLTDAEIHRVKDQLDSKFPIEIQDWVLTDATQAMTVRVGMYYGQVALKNRPSTRWEQQKLHRKTKMADHGQPVLTAPGAVPINPVRVAQSVAYGIADGSKTGKRLREAYEYWAKSVMKPKQDRVDELPNSKK
jgi:hypothetical protein